MKVFFPAPLSVSREKIAYGMRSRSGECLNLAAAGVACEVGVDTLEPEGRQLWVKPCAPHESHWRTVAARYGLETDVPEEIVAPGIAELKELSRRLSVLMDDPHPGLSTWRLALADVLNSLAEFAPRPQG